jgi:hypothetical protein
MSSSFQDDTVATVAEVRDVFAQVLETNPRARTDLAKLCEGFGIHRKLAWQLTKVAYGDDLLQSARFMPSPKGIEAWVRSAADRGVDTALLERVRDVSARFEALVETHAGNRSAMDLLIESCVSTPSEEIDARWRQRSFEGNSFIWGAQVRTLLSVAVLGPSRGKRGWFDIAQVRSLVALRRTRPDTRWLINQAAVILDGQTPRPPTRTPLDDETAQETGGVPVIARFTSNPLPGFERRQVQMGMVNDEILPGKVGQVGEQTIVIGEWIRDLAPAFATPDDKTAHFGMGVRTPAEVLIYDHLVHESLFHGVQRELCVFSELASPITFDDEDRLRVPEHVQSLGMGFSRAHTPDVPGYADLLRFVFDRCEWDASEFALYRVRMAYPPLPTSVMIRHPLPEPPDWLNA